MVSVLVWSVVDRGFIGGVMVSVLVWSAVDRVLGQTNDNKISICCFSLMQVRAAIVWLGIMCPSEASYLPMDYCFSELAQ
jgi:hypothetical protein